MEKDVLLRVREAFLQGVHRPPDPAYAAPGRLFAELLKAKIHSRIAEQEVAVIDSCLAQQHRALMAARRGQVERSWEELQGVRSKLQQDGLSPEGSLLVEVLVDPVEAYCHYRVDDYHRARQLILRSASTNNTLTIEYEYDILSAQRMQLCHNILRITSREGRHKEALTMAAAYLDYLEFGNDSLPEEIAWARVVRDSVPENIIEYYFDQVCGEAALVLAGNNDRELFGKISHHANRRGCSKRFAAHAHKWAAAKQTAIDGDVESYLCQACELLEYGKASELSLWFATMIDVVLACRSLGEDGIGVANAIFDEASSMPEAPLQLRSLAVRL